MEELETMFKKDILANVDLILSFYVHYHFLIDGVEVGSFNHDNKTVLIVKGSIATFEEYYSALKIEDEKERMTLRLKLGEIFSF